MALDKINQESKFNAWRSKVKVTGNEKCKSHFLRISSSKVDRFTSNEDHNDQRSILHIFSDNSPAKVRSVARFLCL